MTQPLSPNPQTAAFPVQVNEQPVPGQKIRPFSFAWGVLFLAIGTTGFSADSFGVAAGATLSLVFLVASCALMYLIFRQRRLVNAARTAFGTGATVAAGQTTPVQQPQNPLYEEALAELDSVDYTVTSPEQMLVGDDPGASIDIPTTPDASNPTDEATGL